MIGLLTPYAVNNYGTKLQAFAVQTLFSQYDDVEILRFVPDIADRVGMKINNILHPTSSFADVIPDQTGKKIDETLAEKRRNAISSFDNQLKFAPVVKGKSHLRALSKQYNAVVCGSDQIWNPINLLMHIYMLEFVPHSVRRIACAPSFGVDRLPDNLVGIYKKRIKNIEFLSVREESGCKIAEKLGRPDAFQSLDPTLIVDMSRWEAFAKKSKYNYSEPYVFCYFLGIREIGRQLASRIREATGYKIINLPHFKTYVRCDEDFADIDLYDVDPIDFVSLIANAEYVVTDSFHGTAFSSIFQKNFYCVERHEAALTASTNDRLVSYLNLLGLGNRMITNMGQTKDGFTSVNWENPHEVLENKKVECRAFIENALKGKRNDF